MYPRLLDAIDSWMKAHDCQYHIDSIRDDGETLSFKVVYNSNYNLRHVKIEMISSDEEEMSND